MPEGAARARAIATWTAVGAGGGAAGGLVGGALVDGLSWRWVLLINVPVGAVVLAGAALWLAESTGGPRRRLDLPGALLVTAGLATLAYGISQTESEGGRRRRPWCRCRPDSRCSGSSSSSRRGPRRR